MKRNQIFSQAVKVTKNSRKIAEKSREIERTNVKLKLQSVDVKVKGAIDAMTEIEENIKSFQIPCPKDIVIPPRSSNPFSGITKEKAELMMKRKGRKK